MNKKYQLILADPPWQYHGSQTKMGAAGNHYNSMSMDDLKKIPIKDVLEKQAAVFMWATCPRLHMAIELIDAWGLNYRGVAYVWVKTAKDGRIINGQGVPPTFTKPTTELLLAATTSKSGRPFPIQLFNQAQVVLSPRGRHSEKPTIFKERLVELCGNVSKLEMFSRETQTEFGWDYWGNEAPRNDIDWKV